MISSIEDFDIENWILEAIEKFKIRLNFKILYIYLGIAKEFGHYIKYNCIYELYNIIQIIIYICWPQNIFSLFFKAKNINSMISISNKSKISHLKQKQLYLKCFKMLLSSKNIEILHLSSMLWTFTSSFYLLVAWIISVNQIIFLKKCTSSWVRYVDTKDNKLIYKSEGLITS